LREALTISLVWHCLFLGLILIFFSFNNEWHISSLIERFGAWDGANYIRIVNSGYLNTGDDANMIAFFPLYPMLIRWISAILPWPHLVGVFISILSSLFGHSLLIVLLQSMGLDSSRALRVVFLSFCSPIFIFFFMIYTEGIFLLLTVLSLSFLYRDRFFISAVLGFFAAMTRNFGIFLIFPFLSYIFFEKRKEVYSKLNALYVLLIPAGWSLYLLLNKVVFGEYFHFLDVQNQHWHKKLANPLVQIFSNLTRFHNSEAQGFELIYVDRAATYIAIALLFSYLFAGRVRIKPGLLLWAFFQLTILCSTTWWYSNLRVLALIFPLYIILEDFLSRRPAAYFVFLAGWFGLSLHVVRKFSLSEWMF